jgi:polar amino acid transport system substrate-binding protein
MALRNLALAGPLVLAAGMSAAADLAEIKARGTLNVIALDDEQPEMFSWTAGANPGFEREMVEGFAKLQGLKLNAVKAENTEQRFPLLLKGQGDLVIGVIDTEARRKIVAFTTEVLPARHLAVNYKPHAPIKSVDELLAARVGVLKGSSWAQVAYEAGVARDKAEGFDATDLLLSALRDGKIDATVMSISDFTLAARRYPGLQGGLFLGPESHAGWALRKEDTRLRAALDEYLENLRKGASWSRLVVKYFGEQALSVLGRAR